MGKVDRADEDRIVRRVQSYRGAVGNMHPYYQASTQDGCQNRENLHQVFQPAARRVCESLHAASMKYLSIRALWDVHMRFGMVARGGIRWSDQQQDCPP